MTKQDIRHRSRLLPQGVRAMEALLEFVAILAEWDRSDTGCKLEPVPDPIHSRQDRENPRRGKRV